MATTLDVAVGQLYSLTLDDGQRILARFRQEMFDGRFKFVREGTDREHYHAPDEFEEMRSDGRASRISDAKKLEGSAAEIEDLNPLALSDPDEPSITLHERAKRLNALKKLQTARTLHFYVIRHDEDPVAGFGHVGIRQFVNRNYEEAKTEGLNWRPSPGAVIRAIKKCGTPGDRPLSAFFDSRGKHDRSKQWPKVTIELAAEMTSEFWSDRKVRMCDAQSEFYAKFAEENRRREEMGEASLTRPSRETLRNWIKAEENYWTYRSRHGDRAASRRFRARGDYSSNLGARSNLSNRCGLPT